MTIVLSGSLPQESDMLRTETQQLIIQLLDQEYRKAKFLKLYQAEVADAKENFIQHLKTVEPEKNDRK